MNNFDNEQILDNETPMPSSSSNTNSITSKQFKQKVFHGWLIFLLENYMEITIPTLVAGAVVVGGVGILLGCLIMKYKIK